MDIIPMHQTNQFYIYTHQHGIYFSKTIDKLRFISFD